MYENPDVFPVSKAFHNMAALNNVPESQVEAYVEAYVKFKLSKCCGLTELVTRTLGGGFPLVMCKTEWTKEQTLYAYSYFLTGYFFSSEGGHVFDFLKKLLNEQPKKFSDQ